MAQAVEVATGGKRIDTAQLATELAAVGVQVRRVQVPHTGGTAPAMTLRDGGATLVVGVESGDAGLVAGVVAAHVAPPQRRPRALAAIRDAVLSLTAGERNRLLATLVAHLALERPGLLARLGSAIPDDEVVAEPAPPP